MHRWLGTLVVGAALLVSTSGALLAQDKPGCDRAATPEKVDGVVLRMDAREGKLTIRDANGTVREFKASKETLDDLKVGDRIEATLRSVPNC